MNRHHSQVLSLALFLCTLVLFIGNGFVARIFAQGQDADVFQQIQPIGDVLDEVLNNYVREPELDSVVEGAIVGMMNSLDDHSSYLPPEAYQMMSEETRGEFEGIGISIHLNDEKAVTVFQPIAGSPAAKAGLIPADVILKVNDVSTKGMGLDQARDLIRGPGGTSVHLTILRRDEDAGEAEILEFDIKRGSIPLTSVEEARVLDGGIGYIRLGDFKETSADEVAERMDELRDQGMKSLVLDLRWNPGGLLSSSKEVCELFLPKGSLVTYTKSRGASAEAGLVEHLRLRTERKPAVPSDFPLIVLTNEQTASSAEIVTGALQYWERAIVVGEKSYGKGSVQTIIPLARPENSAIRLTTALYYTPAEVTIDKQGILPDVEVPMSREQWIGLLRQMSESYLEQGDIDRQNHGLVTGAEGEDVVQDVQLQRAVEILRDEPVFERLIAKYHKDTQLTQRAAAAEAEALDPAEDEDTLQVPAGMLESDPANGGGEE
jgi:carboxyl-terminal processing protease